MPQPRRKKADAPAESDAATAVTKLDAFRPTWFADPDVREIDVREDVTLTVTLAHLTTRQARQIPWGVRVDLGEVYRAAWRYVLDWDVTATNPETGKRIAVPAPGHPDAPAFVKQYIGENAEPWELLEYVLDDDTGVLVMSWLLKPGSMKLVEAQGKKSSTPSSPGDTPSANGDTAKP